MSPPTWILVGLGGFAGSVARYGLSHLVQRLLPSSLFPAGTLVVNVLGCLAIGLLGGLGEGRDVFSPELRLLLLVGLLGGFTTFSTFGYESLALLREANWLEAGLYISLHLVLGLGAVWIGYNLARSALP